MPALIAALLGGLAQIAGSLVGRVLLALGIHMIAYSGLDLILEGLMSYSQQNFTGLPGGVVGIFGLLRVDEVASILSGAAVASMSLNGIRNGVLTKLVHK